MRFVENEILMNETGKGKKSWKQKAVHELTVYWINFAYLFCFFGVLASYRRLMLAEYDITYLHYGIAVFQALVLAKVIMIGDFLHLGRGLEEKPLIVPTLYKTVVFTFFVAIFSILEHTVVGLWDGKGLMEGIKELKEDGKYDLLAKLLIVFFTFIPFFALKELARVLGEGKIGRMFFRRRPAADSDLLSGSDSRQRAH
jgi:hypothetical protein